jgi:hypothetical protein
MAYKIDRMMAFYMKMVMSLREQAHLEFREQKLRAAKYFFE